jgi:hypothetical protein
MNRFVQRKNDYENALKRLKEALIEDEINVSPLFKNKKVIDVPYEYLPTAVINLFEFGSVGKSTVE